MLDYGENYIYPGFHESHCHGYFAGDRAIGQANLMQAGLTDYVKYREIIKEFIAKNPQRRFYVAAGWVENEEHVTKAYLDEICSDKPLLMQTGGGHSMLLNTKALEWAGIDAQYAKEHGYDQVHVDENGEPDGYICETPVMEMMPRISATFEEAKDLSACLAGLCLPKRLYRRCGCRRGDFLQGFCQSIPRVGRGRQAEVAHLRLHAD